MSDTGNSYPHWLGLLKWSLSQTDPAGSSSDFTAMSQENRDFLDAVMKDIVKDEPGDLQKILTLFQQMFERGVVAEDSSRVLNLLDDAQLIVDQIDMANVFLKFGGAVVLKNVLSSDVLGDDCKCSASTLCGELAQNNPTAQVEMLRCGLLDQLAVLCASPDTATKLCARGLYGISCIIRGNKDGENRFCDFLSGSALLQKLLRGNDPVCCKRVMFLANALIMSDFSSPDRVIGILAGIVPDIFPFLDSPDIDTRETYLRLLFSIVSSDCGLKYVLPALPSIREALVRRQSRLVSDDDMFEKDQIAEILTKMSENESNFVTNTPETSHTVAPSTTSCVVMKLSPP